MHIKFIIPKNLNKNNAEDFESQLSGVHAVHPFLPDDTLCCVAISDNTFDCDYISVNSKITCPNCLRIIKYCKNL